MGCVLTRGVTIFSFQLTLILADAPNLPQKYMNKEETIISRVEVYQKNWAKKLVKDKTYESESDYVRTLIDNDIQANSK